MKQFVDFIMKATELSIRIYSQMPVSELGATGIDLVIMPSSRSDLDDKKLLSLRNRFSLIAGDVITEEGDFGVDGIVKSLYKSHQDMLYFYRMNRKDDNGKIRVSDVFVFAKPSTILNIDISINRALVEALGYNADNQTIANTMFDFQSDGQLTPIDAQALRKIYDPDFKP